MAMMSNNSRSEGIQQALASDRRVKIKETPERMEGKKIKVDINLNNLTH